jgi:hypothetical protein
MTCMQAMTWTSQEEKAHNKLNVTIRNITSTGKNNEDVGVVLVTLIHIVDWRKFVFAHIEIIP